MLRQTLPKSHKPRPEWQPVPPRSITGRRWQRRASRSVQFVAHPHPWRLADSIRQTSKEVEEQLRAELKAIQTLLETNGLPMKKTLDKVRKQLVGISALVDFWRQTVRQDLRNWR